MSGANHPTPETNVAELCGVCGLPHKGLTGYNHNFMSHHLPSKQQLPPVYEAWDRDQLVAEIERLTGELFNARQAVLTEGLARDHSDRMLVETRSALERAWNERDRLRAKLGQLATYVQTTMDSGALMRATVVGITSGALSGEPGSAVETAAARDVLAERRRQVQTEGWTPEHDDQHEAGELAKAASCYALCAGVGVASAADLETLYEFVDQYQKAAVPRPPWPWLDKWWKPKSPRRDLVRAGALILAEIERLDRLSGAPESAVKASGEPDDE